MFFWYLYCSRAQPSKALKTFAFTMNFNVFTIQRNIIFNDCPDLFRYQFWDWFSMILGIDFDSIWNPFGIKFHVVGEQFFDYFLNRFLIHFWSKWVQKAGYASLLFRSFSHTLVPFTYVKPTSARNHVFQLFPKK